MFPRVVVRSLAAALTLIALTGCGAHRMPPVDPRAAGNLKPAIEDTDAGLVGIASGFSAKGFDTIVVEPFVVVPTEIKDASDQQLAKDMSTYLQTQLVRKLQAAGIFARVVDASVQSPAAGDRALKLTGEISRLTEGSQAMRYFVGFGAGAAKAQIETRVIEQPSGAIRVVTADRRAAGMGLFGGDGRKFVMESMDQMADGLVNFIKHLAAGGRPGKRKP